MDKIKCVHNVEFDKDKKTAWYQRMTVSFTDTRDEITVLIPAPRGVKPLLTNEEILEKWRMLTGEVIDDSC